MRKRETRSIWFVIAIVCVAGLGYALTAKPGVHDALSGGPADQIVVRKEAHTLELFRQGRLLKTYRVSLGRGGLGPKLIAGDNKVPEGIYRIVGRNSSSAFHRSLKVGYPTLEQAQQAHAQGFDPGSDIMVHGIRNGLGWFGSLHRQVDWTKGCIAVTDDEIEEIWDLVPDGTPIEINR